MDRQTQREHILECRVIAIIRTDSSSDLVSAVNALADGGIDVVEITMTTPNALDAIRAARKECPDVLLGVGSVLDSETARAAILAGAQYVVTPVLRPDVIQTCHRYGCVVAPGAFTPTEIFTAHELGADFVKVFPVNHLGPSYLKDLLAPMPQLNLIPTGGITATNAREYLDAGACAVGVGSAVVRKEWVSAGRFDLLTEAARALVDSI
ncbi:MAG: bifunctional 4-hydroxy-2-oxoglutarate aldolase/2-dehydro-3-deoxy-phosphogluconate aldolase [Candidatus Poribacteria bacterium]|nr:bifunctional 4-hydroxy-2-oxoglutarate aldolase/2-dehydro-3-deoxy-phosphogluconate aldolase [Candidatus Poribacteria bacterium]